MKVLIRGKMWTVVLRRLLPKYHGLCHYDTRTIELDAKQSEKDLLGTAIHEALHAAFPDLSEDAVDEASISVGELVWKLGFRRREQA
jgi:hypothetical protein